MSRRPTSSLVAHPILIGALTVLVCSVMVVLSYNANQGLPFVPRYALGAEVHDAADLTVGADVRIGGARVGSVAGIDARPGRAGAAPYAVLDLQLEQRAGPLPADSLVRVRPRSPLGAKFVEITRGRSPRSIADGGALALANARRTVDLDEALGAFDAPTRRAFDAVALELGNGLAARGGELSQTLDAAGPLIEHLRPVAELLADPATRLRPFVRGLQSTTAALAPVATPLGRSIANAERTFAAITEAEPGIEAVLDELAPTERQATRSLRRLQGVLGDAAALSVDARPAVALLPSAAPRIARALEAGVSGSADLEAVARGLRPALGALDTLVRAPSTPAAVRRLRGLLAGLAPILDEVVPFQVQCNYLGVWTRNITSVIGEGDANGTWLRILPMLQLDEFFPRADPAPGLHVNPYPGTGSDGECEAGNVRWEPGQRIGRTPGVQGRSTEGTSPPAGVDP